MDEKNTLHSHRDHMHADKTNSDKCNDSARLSACHLSSCDCFSKDGILKPEEHPEIFVPIPPDGGWGWVVVFASFMNSFIIDGIAYAYGVLMSELLNSFETSNAQASFIGSLLCGVYLGSGPIAAAIVNKYNCRITSFIGAIISAVAFLLSFFATSINMLMITYGVIGGIGFGLIYLPTIIVVNLYFEKRRPLAVGIAVCGSGFGAFAFPPFVKWLLEIYDWSNCLLVLSGILLNCAVFGALMRPLKAPVEIIFDGEEKKKESWFSRLLRKKKEKDSLGEDGGSKELKELDASNPLLTMPQAIEGARVKKDSLAPHMITSPLKPMTSDEMQSEVIRYAAQMQEIQKQKSEEKQAEEKKRQLFGAGMLSTEKLSTRTTPGQSPNSIRRHSDIRQIQNMTVNNGWISSVPNLGSSSLIKPSSRLILRVTSTNDGHSPRIALPPNVTKEDYSRPMYRKDIFYGGSIVNLASQQVVQKLDRSYSSIINQHLSAPSQQLVGSYVMSLTHIPEESPEEEEEGRKRFFSKVIRDVLSEMTNLTLLSNPAFLLISLSSLLTVGYLTPNFYLPTLASNYNLPDGSKLLSMLGAANMLGRLLFNWMATLSCCSALFINNVTLLLSGVITFFVPLFTSFPLLAAYGIAYGLLASASISLASPIVCNFLGVENLTNAFGLICLARGIASSVGPPLAGAMADVTGNINAPFLFSAGMIIASALVFFPLHLPRFRLQQEQAEADNSKFLIHSVNQLCSPQQEVNASKVP